MWQVEDVEWQVRGLLESADNGVGLQEAQNLKVFILELTMFRRRPICKKH